MRKETKCRHCGKEIIEWSQHSATVKDSQELAQPNHYGGWVCSKDCDINASIRLEASMPGGQPFSSLSEPALKSIERNWANYITVYE